MKAPSGYSIPFPSLSRGKHTFNYLIEHPFFTFFPESSIQEGRIWVRTELNKTENMLLLDFFIQGSVKTTCGRCNEDFDFPLDFTRKLLVKFGEKTTEESDEVLVISRGENELDLAHYIYEFILLALPISPLHPDLENGQRGCNPEILRLLDEVSNAKTEGITGDPRWEALKKWQSEGK